MAQNVNKEVIKLDLQGFEKLKSVKETFGKLNKSLSLSKTEINKTIKSITSFDKRSKGANGTSQRSVNIFKQQIAALKELQNNVAIGGKAYKAFGAEADRLRAKMEALTASTKKQTAFGKLGAGFKAGGGAALIFFYILGYGAQSLRIYFLNKRVWKILNAIIIFYLSILTMLIIYKDIFKF